MTSPYDPPATSVQVQADEREPVEPAPRSDRVGAWIVDRSLALGSYLCGQMAAYLTIMAAWNLGLSSLDLDVLLGAAFAVMITGPASLAVYQTWLLVTTGQTLGRRAVAIRVAAEDGGPPRPSVVLAQALFRTGARLLVLIAFAGALPIALHPDAAEWRYRAGIVGLALLGAAGVVLFFDVRDVSNGQALHDRLLRTRLVRDRADPSRLAWLRIGEPAPRLRVGLVVALVIAIGSCVGLR